MISIILYAFILFIVAILLYAFSRPAVFKVSRQLMIAASAEAVFTEINDFNRWRVWSPWEVKDPNMQRNISGASLGVGTVYEWHGNKNVGQGRMEILESIPHSKICIQLNFIKPFTCQNTAEFTFTSDAAGTLVNWDMYGPQLFISKLMGIFVDMDKMVGGDFETGLSNLKQLVETK